MVFQEGVQAVARPADLGNGAEFRPTIARPGPLDGVVDSDFSDLQPDISVTESEHIMGNGSPLIRHFGVLQNKSCSVSPNLKLLCNYYFENKFEIVTVSVVVMRGVENMFKVCLCDVNEIQWK